MRLSRVEIERFMGIRQLDVLLAKGVALVAGPNNAGKTTLLKAIDYFFEPDRYAYDMVQPRNPYYEEEGSRALTRVRLHFSDLTSAERQSCSTALLPRSGEFWVEVRSSRVGNLGYMASRGADGSALHDFACSAFNVVHVPAVRVDRAGVHGSEPRRLAATVGDALVKARRGRPTQLQEQFSSQASQLLNLIKSVLDAGAQSLSALVPAETKLQFEMPDLAAFLESVLEHVELQTRDGLDLHLSDEGTGFQALLSLGVLQHLGASQSRSAKPLFLIEEPEAFLHPQLQRAVAERLTNLSEMAQVIVTTHSAVIIDSFSLNAVCRLPRQASGLTFTWDAPDLGETKAGQLSRYCDARNSELVFADKVIFCEGATDASVLRELIRLDVGDSFHDLNLSIIETGGVGSAQYFVELAIRFQCAFLLVLDKDAYSTPDGRKCLQRACTATGFGLSQSEAQELAALGAKQCTSSREAAEAQQRANEIVESRSIHCLASDIEGAVAFSYRWTSLREAIGPNGVGHLSQDACDELDQLDGKPAYYQRLRALVGSKGWNTESAGNNKPKPHVLREVVAMNAGAIRGESDMKSLQQRIRKLLGTS